ncbi:hypothetical protein HAPAU_38260 [Halalkalicoccus paucihalophilus]|uniref:Uncharacterized protein n=1 Tax=Halalkalicoccus paucihalophilus TaxID=1008153 RepID=A0A151A9L4_9EURY|nr:hypothetical protein HAPAU_38260 [Halalkalicoccus paucihalophilus]
MFGILFDEGLLMISNTLTSGIVSTVSLSIIKLKERFVEPTSKTNLTPI